MASIKKTASGYRAQLYVKGVRDSQCFRTQREAIAWASARETELREQAGKKPAQLYTLKQALEKYRDEVTPKKRGERAERIRVERILNHRELDVDKLIGEIGPPDIARWRDARLKAVKPGSVLREIAVLQAMFEIARAEWRWIDVNPMRDVRKPAKPQHRERLITRQEIRAMLVALGYRRRGCRSVPEAVAYAFLIALRTGMRAGEICDLRWDQVRDDHLVGVGTKTLEYAPPRDVPLTHQARAAIERCRGWDAVKVVGIDSATLDTLFRRYRDRAGLSGFTFHDSRHTAATWMAGRLHVLDLCKAFGWKGTARALTYYNPTASDIAARLRAR